MKRLVYILIVLLVIGGVALLAYRWFFQAAPGVPIGGGGTLPPIAVPPLATSSVPGGSTITIQTAEGGVQVKNFYQTAKVVNSSGALLLNNAGYQIVYLRATSKFLIPIQAYSVADAIVYRKQAEEDLLSRLGIGEENACKLSVDVRVPSSYVRAGDFPYDLSAMNYGLSFCPNGVQFSQ